jgi:hypothetical protein
LKGHSIKSGHGLKALERTVNLILRRRAEPGRRRKSSDAALVRARYLGRTAAGQRRFAARLGSRPPRRSRRGCRR